MKDRTSIGLVVARCSAILLMFACLPHGHARLVHRQKHPLVVAYFGQSGIYRNPPYYLRDLVRNGGAALLDQLNYAHAAVTGGRCSIADPRADLEAAYTKEASIDGTADDAASPFRGYFHQLKELKRRYPDLKVFISLEGTAESFREDAQPQNLRAFVSSCVDIFLRGHLAPGLMEPGIFDGVDVDWEYPEQADAENFRMLLKEFRRQMNGVRHGLKLAIAVGDQPQMQPGTNFRQIAPLVDEIGIMNYDYTGPWERTTGFLAPLFSSAESPRGYGSVAESVAAYERAGVPSHKLLMGVPFYGYQWSGVNPSNHGLYQRGKGIAEDKPYRVIRELQPLYSKFRNPKSQAPWLFDGENFWTFDDPTSIAYKSSYAAHHRLAGIMIWELGDDTVEASLLTAAWQYLHHPAEEPEETEAPRPALGGS